MLFNIYRFEESFTRDVGEYLYILNVRTTIIIIRNTIRNGRCVIPQRKECLKPYIATIADEIEIRICDIWVI